jgi:hypothetical protein
MAEPKRRGGIPGPTVIGILTGGAVTSFALGGLSMAASAFRWLTCNATDGTPDTYCTDGSWNASDGFSIALYLGLAGVLMLILASTYRSKSTPTRPSALPPPPAPVSWTCPNCNVEMPRSASFCGACGMAFPTQPSPDLSHLPPPPAAS